MIGMMKSGGGNDLPEWREGGMEGGREGERGREGGRERSE